MSRRASIKPCSSTKESLNLGLILCDFLTWAEEALVQVGAVPCSWSCVWLEAVVFSGGLGAERPVPLLLIFCSVDALFSAKQVITSLLFRVPVSSAVP